MPSSVKMDSNYKRLIEYYSIAKLTDVSPSDVSCDLEKKELKDVMGKVFPGSNRLDLIWAYSMSTSISDFVERATLDICKKHLEEVPKKPRPVRVVAYYAANKGRIDGVKEDARNSMMNLIDVSLTVGIPAAVSYYTSGLIESFNKKEGIHSRHSSAVMGRFWQDGKCQYVVKNSWGTDWAPSKESVAKSLEGYPGYFVVSEEDLRGSSYEATSFFGEN